MKKVIHRENIDSVDMWKRIKKELKLDIRIRLLVKCLQEGDMITVFINY